MMKEKELLEVEELLKDFSSQANQLVERTFREYMKHPHSKLDKYDAAADLETVPHSNTNPPLDGFMKLLNQMFVWPPSCDLTTLELTVLSNTTLLTLGKNSHCYGDGATSPHCRKLEALAVQVVHRATQSLGVKAKPSDFFLSGQEVEEGMDRFVASIIDPILHFKALPILGRLLVLCSAWCLYRKQQKGRSQSERALACLGKLNSAADSDVRMEKLPQTQGLFLCPSAGTENPADGVCVADVVTLVLSGFGKLSHPQSNSICDQWQWLATLFTCSGLIQKGSHFAAMKLLEPSLQRPLDPEAKARLLSLFARCYLAQGCPQLAIQTYRSALETDVSAVAVLSELSQLYGSLDQPELELEVLAVLIKKLKHQAQEPNYKSLNLQLDNIVASLFNVFPTVHLIPVLHHYAKCSFGLRRFKVASEQYLALLQMIQKSESPHTSSPESTSPIEEIVVETAECLLSNHQHADCTLLCDDFLPYLTADDSLFRESQEKAWLSNYKEKDIFDFNHCVKAFSEDGEVNDSQGSLFSSSPHSPHRVNDAPICDSNVRDSGHERSVVTESGDCHTPRNLLDQTWCKSVFRTSRKRNRSSVSEHVDVLSGGGGECEDNRNASSQNTIHLAVRMYLCRTDAEVVAEGTTDTAMDSLLKAYNLLIDNKAAFSYPKVKSNQFPSAKRRRLDPDAETLTESDNTLETSKDLWSSLMVKVAVRMAKVALQRQRFPSVLNSCHLLLQLEPKHTEGHYLRTTALHQRTSLSDEDAGVWLRERGTDRDKVSSVMLRTVLKDKREELGKLQSRPNLSEDEPAWWKTRSSDLLTLDIACLEHILGIGRPGDRTESHTPQGFSGITASQFDMSM